MAYTNEDRRTIVAVDAAFRAMKDVAQWGCDLVTCTRCHQPAPALNVNDRCAFCDLTGFLFVADGAQQAKFIWTGSC